ncbi:uncharacterized protein [Gossypium hirsutum]|uniref:Uncharacterized protein isoform X1 n=1 Tax=Gossypium hirsutum TaxID=3635 RepID=A0ABM2YT59_GOSHI|nr:uncharacterized protein LOC121206170 isoform X1 [Gossypium hirsutum]
MTTTHSADSDSIEPTGSVFLGERVVTSFPRHEVVKLDDNSFVQWQQQIRLLDGSLTAPARLIQSFDAGLVVNPLALAFDQQDSLLTSWLLSTISSPFLSSFTEVQTAHDVWLVANNLFAADSSTKQSHLRHELHSLRNGSLSIRSYVNKITNLCALLAASGSQISETERTAVLLASLPSDFDTVVSSVSLSPGSLPVQRIVDTLLECEARQLRTAHEVLMAANVVQGPPLPSADQTTTGSFRGGRSTARSSGRSFRPRVQCQICSRYGHLAQRRYYRYNRDESSPLKPPAARRGGFAPGQNRNEWARGDRLGNNVFSQNWMIQGQNWRPYSWPNFALDNYAPRGPHAANPFVINGHGHGQYNNADPNFNPAFYGREVDVGRPAAGPHVGDDSLDLPPGNMASQTRGLRGSVRSRPTDSNFMPGPLLIVLGLTDLGRLFLRLRGEQNPVLVFSVLTRFLMIRLSL